MSSERGVSSERDYASFGYLDDAPAAFARFPLAPQSGRVPAYDGGFDAPAVARAEQLLARNIVVSLHDHPVRFPADMSLTPQYNRTGRQHTAFAGLAASGLTVVFDNTTGWPRSGGAPSSG
jgi:membrane dipeptidase